MRRAEPQKILGPANERPVSDNRVNPVPDHLY